MQRIQVGALEIGKKEKKAVNEVLRSGRISEGRKVYEFERKWANFIGTEHCIATSSGTAALITALTALKYLYNLKNRPKVITTPLTYISDIHAIVLSGFEPVFIDISLQDFCIIPEKIKEYLQSAKDAHKHSVILAVDLMGYPVRLQELKKIAKEYGLYVLEDSAQAHGTIYNGATCGSQADAGIFSFYIAHNIQAGEMGAITTNSEEIYCMSKKVKANGRFCACKICTRHKGSCPPIENYEGEDDFDPRFYHEFVGYNFKTMEFPAAIALAQLDKIKEIIKKRRENVRYLNCGLAEFADVLQLPIFSEKVSYLAYPLLIKNPKVTCRKELREELEKRGIESRPLFGSIPTQQPAYAYLKNTYENKIPNADYVGKNGFYIGCHQYLNNKELDYIIYSFKKIMGKRV